MAAEGVGHGAEHKNRLIAAISPELASMPVGARRRERRLPAGMAPAEGAAGGAAGADVRGAGRCFSGGRSKPRTSLSHVMGTRHGAISRKSTPCPVARGSGSVPLISNAATQRTASCFGGLIFSDSFESGGLGEW